MMCYTYRGPVMEFGRCIENNWFGQTQAISEAKARNNLVHQYKRRTGRLQRSKIELPGQLVLEGENNG